jgi:hypothetical protein
LLPLTIVWLSFGRLVKSKGGNTWIYALTCLFSLATTMGLLPWALGLAQAGWLFFVFAAFCPAIWIGVITVCDLSRREMYGVDSDHTEDEPIFKSRQKPRKKTPLVLENPKVPDAPIPVFRHRAEETGNVTYSRDPLTPATLEPKQDTVDEPRSALSIVREMRGRDTSDARRPRMLPAPGMKQLPLAEG